MSDWWSGFLSAFLCFVGIPVVTIAALRMSGILDLTVVLVLSRSGDDEDETEEKKEPDGAN